MKNRLIRVAAGIAALLTSATAATYSGITKSELVSVLAAAGISAQATSNQEVLSAGASFILLTDCDSQSGRCNEICIFRNYADVRPTLDAVNKWNSTKKIPEASINADGTLHLEFWLTGIGATEVSIVDSVSWFNKYAADIEFWGPYIKMPNV